MVICTICILSCTPILIHITIQNGNFYFWGFITINSGSIELPRAYYDALTYVDYTTVFLSFCLDIATFIRIRKFLKSQMSSHKPEGMSKERLWRDGIFLLQNFLDATFFMITLIPTIYYLISCKGYDAYCYFNNLGIAIVMLYHYNMRRPVWRIFSQFMAFLIQIWSYWKYDLFPKWVMKLLKKNTATFTVVTTTTNVSNPTRRWGGERCLNCCIVSLIKFIKHPINCKH